MASIMRSLHPFISSAKTSTAAWSPFSRIYANRSHTRLLGLPESLKKFTKKTKLISGYMITIKGMVDNLALISHTLIDDDIVVHILAANYFIITLQK
ncbi:hypothetical protein ACOSP7_020897 [Xanthoceras sorbifolium]